jgi:hypothetical protein
MKIILNQLQNVEKYFLLSLIILLTNCTTTKNSPKNSVTTNSTEKQKIEQVIQLFVDGWAIGDATKAGQTLHDSWSIKYFRENKFSDMTRTEYLSHFVPREKSPNLQFRILSIDVADNVAMAKTEITNETSIFTDYLSLIRTDKGWFIVGKITNRAKKNNT